MKKPVFLLLLTSCLSLSAFSQIRVSLTGGVHMSAVSEENDLAGWDTLKNNYSERTGVHFGFLADMPFNPGAKLSFQPGVVFYNKGRKFSQDIDTGNVASFSSTEYINYIDIPLNIVYRAGRKLKFILGAGPYLSFFYSGKTTMQTRDTSGFVESAENNDLPNGNRRGQYRVFNTGVNALAGFEINRVYLTANYSRGLNDFFEPSNYIATDYKHQVYGISLGIYIGKPVLPADQPRIKDRDKDGINDDRDACPNEAGAAISNGCPDKDGDGISDKDDKCPDVTGSAILNGCPYSDTDGDGIADNEDRCPSVTGSRKYNGCPVPDTDKDGVNDEEDVCPTVPGYGRYAGCPIPDTDADGVDDEKDHCPTTKGLKEKNGCPEIPKEIVEKVNLAARRIQFARNKAELLPESKKVLHEIAEILKEKDDLRLNIEGHTSNDGNLEANMRLSLARAETVKFFLQSLGIDANRLKARGFGPTQPIKPGRTEAEKSQNRRVELKLSN